MARLSASFNPAITSEFDREIAVLLSNGNLVSSNDLRVVPQDKTAEKLRESIESLIGLVFYSDIQIYHLISTIT